MRRENSIGAGKNKSKQLSGPGWLLGDLRGMLHVVSPLITCPKNSLNFQQKVRAVHMADVKFLFFIPSHRWVFYSFLISMEGKGRNVPRLWLSLSS